MHHNAYYFLFKTLANFLFISVFTAQGCTHGVTSPPSSVLTIAAVGDTSGYKIPKNEQDQSDPLQQVRHLIDPQDIFIYNYEGVMLSEASSSIVCMNWPRQSLLLGDPQLADFLHATNIPIATLANNHIFDCGNLGIQDTMYELSSRGIRIQGAGEDSTQACLPLRFSVNGVHLALVSYLVMVEDWFYASLDRPGVAGWEQCSGKEQLAKLAATEDIVIVALHLHLGEEWTHQQLPKNIDTIKSILDAGADIVLAHGPHVPQGVLVRDGKFALLSLGNFLFNPDIFMPDKAHDSIIAKITLLDDRFKLEIFPLRLDEAGRPVVASTREASKILRQLVNLSAVLGTDLQVGQEQTTLTIFRNDFK